MAEFKALVFMGTQAGLQLVNRLNTYTENIYAVVAPEYGFQEHPMGNMTLITSFLDEAGMQRWIDRVGFSIIIDGVTSDRPDLSERIKAIAEKNGIEYLKVLDKFNMISGISVCKSEEDFIERSSGLMGNVIADSVDLFEKVAESYAEKQTLFAMVDPNPENIGRLKELGCPESNIFCFGSRPSSEFLTIFFSEYNFAFFLIDGERKVGLVSKFNAIDRSNVKAFLLGDPSSGEGLTADKAMRYIRKTFELTKL